MYEPLRPVETDHLAETVPKAMPMGLGQIVEFVPGNIHAARGHFVKQRLPEMRTSPFDERDVREPVPAEPITKASHEFQPASASADDDDAMKIGARSTRWHMMVRDGTRHRSNLRSRAVNIAPSFARASILD